MAFLKRWINKALLHYFIRRCKFQQQKTTNKKQAYTSDRSYSFFFLTRPVKNGAGHVLIFERIIFCPFVRLDDFRIGWFDRRFLFIRVKGQRFHVEISGRVYPPRVQAQGSHTTLIFSRWVLSIISLYDSQPLDGPPPPLESRKRGPGRPRLDDYTFKGPTPALFAAEPAGTQTSRYPVNSHPLPVNSHPLPHCLVTRGLTPAWR
jgi:hypothetical protein